MRVFQWFTSSALASLLVACANDHQRTCAEGAAAGAFGGAVVGQVVGRDTTATAIGALIGSVAGAAFGCKVADQKAAFARREAELTASAQRASMLADASRADSQRLGRQVAVLGQSVQNLRSAQMEAQARHSASLAQQRQVSSLQLEVDQRLRSVREEIARQTETARAAEAENKRLATLAAPSAPPPSEGLQLVSAGIRELDQQSRALELVKQQLQQIDRRRAY